MQGVRTEHDALVYVNECFGDYLLGLEISQFADANGGIDGLFETLKRAHLEYEIEFNTYEDDECKV